MAEMNAIPMRVAENDHTVRMTAEGGVIRAVSPTVDLKDVTGGVEITVKDIKHTDSKVIHHGGSMIYDRLENQDIATFPDGADNMPITELVIGVEPVQEGSGDPYPAGGGKNKFNAQYTSEKTQQYCNFNNGVFTVKAVPSANDSFLIGTVDLKAGQSYILNGGYSNSFRCYVRVDNTNYTSSGSDSNVFTPASDQTVNVTVVLNSDASVGWQLKPMIRLASISDPTFAPYENKRPITGWDAVVFSQSGANVWDEEWEQGVYDTTTGGASSSSSNLRCKNRISVRPNTTYYARTAVGNLRIFYYDETDTYISYEGKTNATFTTPANCAFVRFCTANYGTTYNNNISINYPSTDTAYHAYTGQTHTADLPSTVFGGQLRWTDGKADSAYGIVTYTGSNDEEWVYGTHPTSGQGRVTCRIPNDALLETNDLYGNIIKANDTVKQYPSDWCAVILSASKIAIGVPSTITSADAFKALLNTTNLVVCYRLATPIEIPLANLTPITTLEGLNHLWADCGPIQALAYPCDTKGYIDKRIAELQALILENT